MKINRRRLMTLAGPVLAGPFVAGAAPAQTASPPLDAFFAEEAAFGASLSPDGRRIALSRRLGTDADAPTVLDILNAEDLSSPPRRVSLGDLEAEWVQWVSESRLLVRVMDIQTLRGGDLFGSNFSRSNLDVEVRRVLSVDVDVGGTPVILFGSDRNRLRYSFHLGAVVDLLPDDPDHVLMAAAEHSGDVALHKVNVLNGQARLVERGSRRTVGWHVKDGVAVMRRDLNLRGTMETIYARAPGESEWKFVRRSAVNDQPEMSWIADGDERDAVLVSARRDGEDELAVRRLDLHDLSLGPPIDGRPGRDVAGAVLDARGVYLGAAYYGDRLEYVFADRGLAAIHRAMNRFFDDECNVSIQELDRTRNRMLVYASGPREAGGWYLFDVAARHFTAIASRTALTRDQLAPVEAVRVQTRDGATLDAYLTVPLGARPGPLVVLPHGGPEVRDVQDWDRQAQVFAAQGWWVLQPNFRGSGGYGRAFAAAGWKRWGDRMQEDVEDAVAQVIRDKGLPADKVAIMGSSYGGYAAMMGAVRRPDLYKACISICGVSDLPEVLNAEDRDDDTPGKRIYAFWTERIGDPGTDRAMLEEASPRRRAAEIACPVLLVHGELDEVVPVHQSRRMEAALKRAGKSVQYLEVPGYGHADWFDDIEKTLMRLYVETLRAAFA